MLDVTLRNRIHAVMSEVRHARWFDEAGMLVVENQQRQLAKAIEDVARDGKSCTAGRLVCRADVQLLDRDAESRL